MKLFLSLMIALLMLNQGAYAADDKAKEARRMQLLQQKIAEEKSQLESEKAALQKKLTDQEQELAASKKETEKIAADEKVSRTANAGFKSQIGNLQKENADLKNQLAELKKSSANSISEVETKLEDMNKVKTQQNLALQTRLNEKSKLNEVCEDKNQRLVMLGKDLLNRYRNKSVMDAAKQREPFLQYKDVEMFNLVQDYQGKIDEQTIDSQAGNQAGNSAGNR